MKSAPTLQIKAAVVQGQTIKGAEVAALATMPGKPELYAKLLFLLQAPMTNLVRVLNAVPRDLVDEAVAVCGVREKRSDGKLPAHVATYLTLALCLFPDDDYTEVATKVTGALTAFGCWDAGWSVPTTGGITGARKRLGPKVMAEVFVDLVGPTAAGEGR